MKSILPKDTISSALPAPVTFQEYGLAELDTICHLEPETVYGVSMNVWNRIVQYKYRKVNPMALASQYAHLDPFVHQGITKIIGESVIKDIYYLHGTVDDQSIHDTTVCQLLVAQVFPNDLQLGDIFLSNPYKPIPPSKPKHRFQKYQGYGLLPTVLNNLETVGRSRNCKFITLTAASIDQYRLFLKHGFSAELNPMTQKFLAMALNGTQEAGGIPMEKRL